MVFPSDNIGSYDNDAISVSSSKSSKSTSTELSKNFSNFYDKVVKKIVADTLKDALAEMDKKLWPVIQQHKVEFMNYLKKKAANDAKANAKGGKKLSVMLRLLDDANNPMNFFKKTESPQLTNSGYDITFPQLANDLNASVDSESAIRDIRDAVGDDSFIPFKKFVSDNGDRYTRLYRFLIGDLDDDSTTDDDSEYGGYEGEDCDNELETGSVYSDKTVSRKEVIRASIGTPEQDAAVAQSLTRLDLTSFVNDQGEKIFLGSDFKQDDGPCPWGRKFNAVRLRKMVYAYDRISKGDEKTRNLAILVMMNYVNRFYGVVMTGSVVCVFKYNSRGYVCDIDQKNYVDVQRNFNVTINGHPFFTLWHKHDHRHTLDKIVSVIAPPRSVPHGNVIGEEDEFGGDNYDHVGEDHVNVYLGTRCEMRRMAVDNYTFSQESIQPLIDHMMYMAQGDMTTFRYLKKWHKDAFVKHLKTNITIIIHSPQGVGKGIWFEQFIGKQVLGTTGGYRYITDFNKLIRKFNFELFGATLVVVDEVSEIGKAFDGALKTATTSDLQSCEPKGREVATTKNRMNIVALTNHEKSVVRIESSDRRYFVIEMKDHDEVVKDAYLERLLKCVADPMSAVHFMEWLAMDDEIDSVNLRKIPETAAKRKMRIDSIPKGFSMLQRLYQEEPFWNERDDGWTKQQVFVDIMKRDFPNENYTCHDVHLMFTKLGMTCCRKKTILWKMLPYEEFKANMEHLKYWDDSM